ncbi:MAG: DUF2231 domain-containing protein [candidate division KSB1 bacterium]|nr:DUF2231 domain-containing protein [candidate division KSB1 bacterium]MDZ7304677.1 DUF2231 domain-containing protein [candidate division KSB1 bacterium]MDZ7313791.1 DUF2231 domain-containing protein [candidate division KSB1 bacterium]
MPPDVHPLVIHFPIALLSTSVFFDVVAYRSGRESLEKAAHWNLVLGMLAAVGAVLSGLLAEDAVPPFPVMQETVACHKALALGTLSVFVLLLVWRLLKGGRFFQRWRAWYLLLACIGVLLIGATAYYGGVLVYEFGVGVPSQPWWQK